MSLLWVIMVSAILLNFAMLNVVMQITLKLISVMLSVNMLGAVLSVDGVGSGGGGGYTPPVTAGGGVGVGSGV